MAKKFIFSSCSYLVLYKFEKSETSLVEKVAKQEGFRLFYADNPTELAECVEKIQYPIDYYIHAKNGEIARILSEENLLKKFGLHYEILSDFTDESLKPMMENSLKRLMPEGIPSLISTTVNFVFPRVFTDAESVKFKETHEAAHKADFAILGSSASNDWVGQCFIYLQFDALRKTVPAFANRTEIQIIDGFRELANQIIGVVNFNLSGIGISAGSTLPIGFDLRNGAQKPRNTIYTQLVRLDGADGAIRIEFGPLLSGKGTKTNQIELDRIRFSEPGEVEML